MKQPWLVLLAILASLAGSDARAQGPQYPSLSEYLMPPDAEMALARSAAPANIADRATIKVLTTSGYRAAHEADPVRHMVGPATTTDCTRLKAADVEFIEDFTDYGALRLAAGH